jgi:Pyruvate/2-oxoglutarate dehydrogenase complex, dihydrolipoamide acyltransferase (E2) component, and related enzymes
MAEIRMPKMGDGMEEGTVLRWLKKEGDRIEKNESIAEIETDKANVEVPAEDAGVLTQIVVHEGQTVPVGAVIAHVGTTAGAAPSAPPAPNGATKSPSSARADSAPSDDAMKIGEAGSATNAPSVGGSFHGEHPESGPSHERVKASPLARRMAEEAGIDLAQVTGSGPGGRIVERDIAAFKESQHGALPTMPSAPAAPAETSRPLAAPVAPTLTGEDVTISKMRKRIAKVTVQSKQTIPHFYLVVPIEMDRSLQLLNDMNAQNPADKITVNDLIVKACAVALQRVPDVNVSFTPEEKVRRYSAINIGVAVVTDQGLTIPVIPDCGNKTLRQISADAKVLIGKARGGSITPQEMSGGTFSVSNLGMFGVEEFMAIINPPESAMLAVGAAAKEVAVAEDGSFEARSRMRVSLSCDHRAVDGALGARFLQVLKELLENPLNLLA